MKVLSIVATERTNSITNRIVDSLLFELKNRYQKIDIIKFRQNELNIKVCKGCNNCFMQGKCILDEVDDLKILKKQILDSDLIIVGTPIFLNFINGYTKLLLDRLAYWSHIFALAGKQVVFVLTASQSGIENAETYLYKVASHLGCVNISFIDYNSSINNMNYANQLIIKTVDNIFYFKNKGRYSTKFQEEIFKYNKLKYENISNKNLFSVELNYWRDSNLLYCETFQQYLEKFLI